MSDADYYDYDDDDGDDDDDDDDEEEDDHVLMNDDSELDDELDVDLPSSVDADDGLIKEGLQVGLRGHNLIC